MFDFLKKSTDPKLAFEAEAKKEGFFSKLKNRLVKTKHHFSDGLSQLLLGKKKLDQALFDALEAKLLSADVGVLTTQKLISVLTNKLARNELSDSDAALACLQAEMISILSKNQTELNVDQHKPFVILVVGMNGAGKTTSIGKLAYAYKQQNKNVMLAAGDTFRAAAIEQLRAWGERNKIAVIASERGADTAAVIFDAQEAASARGMDILLADTAGRLHTQGHLMNELQKVSRVLKKRDSTAPHETWIVLDATLGQNALQQVKQFHDAIGLTGIILTKLDGTAKGGILFAISEETKLPIRYIGVGEAIEDLEPFSPDAFVRALFE